MFGDQAPQTFTKEAFNSESKSMTASTQQFDAKKVNIYGHIVGLIFFLSVTGVKGGSGVFDTAKTVVDSFNRVTIRDKDSRPILDDDGVRLPIYRKILTLADQLSWGNFRKGEYDAASAIADTASAQTYVAFIPLDINLADQPISVEWELGTLSEVFSTTTGATATAQLRIATVNVIDPRYATVETRRIYSFTKGAIATEEELQNFLPTGITIDNITLGVTTDSNLTDVTLKPNGQNIGIDKLLREYVEQIEARNFVDGHTSAYHTLDHAPFKVGDSTIFKINPSTSFTPRFIIVHRGVR